MPQVQVSPDVMAARAEIDVAIAGKTLPLVFAETVERLPDSDALKWRVDGAWRVLTWRQYREAVVEVTLGLLALGFGPGQFLLIWSRNRPEPHIADLATLHARGCPVSLYNTLAPEQAAYIANHCEASIAVVENRDFLRKLDAVRGERTHLRRVVLLDGEPEPGEDWLVTFESVRAAGPRRGGALPPSLRGLVAGGHTG